MKSSHTPTKHAIPFGQNGNKRDIPQETKTGSGEASLSLGFPPETMVPKVSGGIPPSGKDFNGILNELSAMGRWANAGAGYPFDAAFANAIGGYPAGAKIPNSENSGFWLNTVDNNLDNPEVTDDRLTGWVPAENYGIATLSGLAKTDVTLTALQAAKARIVLTGDLKANVAVIFPSWQKSWTVVNQCTGSGSLMCRTKAGAGVVIPNGESREIVGDGSGLVQRIVNATTSAAGITQLSSATDSDSETMAATPKAVKAAYDMASTVSVDGLYPVGIVVWFAQNKDPNKLFSGTTWKYIGEDRTVRLASANGSDIMTTGGADSIKLTVDNLPAHNHTFSANTSSFDYGNKETSWFDYGNKGTDVQGNHTHDYVKDHASRPAQLRGPEGGENSAGYEATSVAGAHAHTVSIGGHKHTVGIGAHSHSVSGATANTGSGVATTVTNAYIKLMGWYRSA